MEASITFGLAGSQPAAASCCRILQVRLVFHVADAPAHGREFWQSNELSAKQLSDASPGGDPLKRDLRKLLQELHGRCRVSAQHRCTGGLCRRCNCKHMARARRGAYRHVFVQATQPHEGSCTATADVVAERACKHMHHTPLTCIHNI